jgi:hypothetical protein
MHKGVSFVGEQPSLVGVLQNDCEVVTIIEHKWSVNDKSVQSFRFNINFFADFPFELISESCGVHFRAP